MKIYNTEREQKELQFLKSKYQKVVCPNNDIGELGGIQPYLEIVKKMDIVVFSEYQNHIGKGVYEEVKTALMNNIPVKVLRGKGIKTIKDVIIVNEYDWEIEYAKVLIK
jgi:hypothetical protein